MSNAGIVKGFAPVFNPQIGKDLSETNATPKHTTRSCTQELPTTPSGKKDRAVIKQRVKRTSAGKRDRVKKISSKAMLNTINEKKPDGDTPKQAINNEYTAKLRQRKTVDVTVATGMPQTNSSKIPSSQNEDVHDCDDSTATEPLSNVINNKSKMVDLVDITIEDDDATNNKHKPSAAWTIQDWEGTPKDKDNIDSSAMALITPSKKSSDQDCDTDTDREDIQDKAVSTPTRSGSVVDESTYDLNRSQQKARPKGLYQRKSVKIQAKLQKHTDETYSRTHQIRFDFRIRLDSIMMENEAKSAIVVKFKEMIGKIMEEENTMVLYPYSSSSSAVPITAMARMPNTFIELKRYVPSIKPPLKDSDLVYGQIFIGTNSTYQDWNTNFLEWTKDNGHGLFLKYVQDERLTVAGYLLYTHKMSNSPWYQALLSKKSNIPIAARFRKISGQKPRERAAIHIECARDNHDGVKTFLRQHCSKNTKPPYLTGFPIIFIPDKRLISNKHSKSGAQIVAKRQGNLASKIILRTS